MRTVRVAFTGFGAIGRRIAAMLVARRADYQRRHAVEVRITGVCGSTAGLVDAAGLALSSLDDRGAFEPGLTGPAFIDQVPADVLFEAGPTDFRSGGPALAYLRAALGRGLHAVVLSKGALVRDVQGLQALADRQRVELRISGATASSLPTIDLLRHDLAGCRVRQIEAILTGTTNLVLSEMMDRGCRFEDALAEAQRLGIAEPDPSLDIDGWDTACKLTILANAVFHAGLDVQTLRRSGIGHVRAADVQAWRAQGLVPRLVGVIDRGPHDAVDAGVDLRLYPQDHPFSRVHGRLKAIRVVTDEMGELTVTGGASDPQATAGAALKDFEHVLRAMA